LDRLNFLLVIILLLSFQQNSNAQNRNSIPELNAIDKSINESIFITTNANTFLTGETLYYKLFCLDQATNIVSGRSKIAYVELIDSSKKTIFTHKLFLKNGTTNGDFFIPTTLETGNYKLIGYTNWMLNKSNSEYFNITISIINPYQISPTVTNNTPLLNKSVEEKQKKSTETSHLSNKINDALSIELNKKTFSNREHVALKVKSNIGELTKGHYSLSVRKTDDLSINSKLSSIEYRTSY
jgi:hypothetical protein